MFEKLVSWSNEEFSWLPWRNNRTLYRTLVSEIMLQQTTVSTVLNHFERFIEVYPDTWSVAAASDEQLTISWKGLGYYRRARNLKKACEYFCSVHRGEIPLDYAALIQAPGIGEYTANALLAIGANQRALALDANLERVLSRLYGVEEMKGPKLLKELGRRFALGQVGSEMVAVGARAYNEALMDLGRNYCKANQVYCELCPLADACLAFEQRRQLELPIKPAPESKKSYELTLLRVLCFDEDKIMAVKKESDQWLSGQYEAPTFILESEDSRLSQYPKLDFDHHHFLPEYKTVITKYKITNKVLVADRLDLKKLRVDLGHCEWRSWKDKNANFSTATMKALDLLK